jgi:hypothetical protein
MRLAVRVETGDVRWLGGSITNGDVSFPNTGERQQDEKTATLRLFENFEAHIGQFGGILD